MMDVLIALQLSEKINDKKNGRTLLVLLSFLIMILAHMDNARILAHFQIQP